MISLIFSKALCCYDSSIRFSWMESVNNMNKRVLITVVISTVFLLGIMIGIVAARAQRLDPLPAGAPYTPNEAESTIAGVYQNVVSSVVNIDVSSSVGGQMGAGTGSGFVIDTEGHIVTNNHVVENASYIEVSFVDGTVLQAELIGNDPGSDLAVIKIDPSQLTLKPLFFADSNQVFVGQDVMAIGSPFGEAQAFTLTTGIVGGLDRSLPSVDSFSLPELIQTDAAINPGNSGGPLLDRAGNVVGVNTAILGGTRTASGVGFAIPSNTVRRVVPYLIQNGEYKHSWLGIAGMTVTPAQREAMHAPADLRGVMVREANPQGPAAAAGLNGTTETVETPRGSLPINGDVITAVDGNPVTRMSDLISYLETQTQPGDTITLTVWRNGETIDIQVTLGERPTNTIQ
jgi:2-alkenal reductase